MDSHSIYQNPLISRYARRQMAEHWSDRHRIGLWRRLWLSLARAQAELGLPVRSDQIDALERTVDEIDFESARAYEKRLRHDVMAHVHAFGDAAPEARAILHLGATSCYVTDNADLILIRDALRSIRNDLLRVIFALDDFARVWKDLPCLGYTHFQPAQLVTVGKRATLWCQDLVLDLDEIERRIERMAFLGAKGTTGTQASFLALFDGDHTKVESLDRMIAADFGFARCFAVSGQTYPRKLDTQVMNSLAGIGESAHRFGTDLRLLQHEGELVEPFEVEQVGSSAMAYKRNPMRAERLCSLARLLLNMVAPAAQTSSTQWLERTLDDSAIRRIVIPQSFLAADAVLSLYLNIVPGIEVRPAVIARHVSEQLPAMATENILMAAVRAGGDRQTLHERIRQHSLASARRANEEGVPLDILERLKEDDAFARVNLAAILNPKSFVGRSPEQVEDFRREIVAPLRSRFPEIEPVPTDLSV